MSRATTANASRSAYDRVSRSRTAPRDIERYEFQRLPSRNVALAELRSEVGVRANLADEKEVASVFDDFALGAVPPLGYGYGIATIVDDSLAEQPDVYFEGGDHVSLLLVKHDDFTRLMRFVRHGRFSERWEDVE